MSALKSFTRSILASAALFTLVSTSRSADYEPVPYMPNVVGTPSVSVGTASCETGSTCNRFLGIRDRKAIYTVNLCPSACFGYFPTQWRKWDELCAHPSAAPLNPPDMVMPQPIAPPPTPQPMPKVLPEPKKGGNSIPVPGPNKIIPPNTGTPQPSVPLPIPEPKKVGSVIPPLPGPNKFLPPSTGTSQPSVPLPTPEPKRVGSVIPPLPGPNKFLP